MKAIRPFQGYFATKTYPKDQYRGAMWTQGYGQRACERDTPNRMAERRLRLAATQL